MDADVREREAVGGLRSGSGKREAGLSAGVRLVYGVDDDDALAVIVMAVDKRDDGLVYRAVLSRIEQLLSGLSKPAAASDDE